MSSALTTNLLIEVHPSLTITTVILQNRVTILPTILTLVAELNLTGLTVSGLNTVTTAKSESHVVPLLVFGYQVLRTPGRIRTCDRQLRRLLLFPLSYGGIAPKGLVLTSPTNHD